MEDGVGLVCIDGDCGIDQFHFERAGRRNVQIRHVASMTGASHDAVVRVAWIEVRTRRLERRRLALTHGMNVEACSPGGIPLSESLSRTPAGVCSSETVPTSWRFVSLSWAMLDWAAAESTSAVDSMAAMPTARAHFRMFMP
jgi:hypothetical protein